MLRKEASVIHPETLQLLELLMEDTQLSPFALAGGTAVALRLGHRRSVDLDLFAPKGFSRDRIHEHVSRTYDFQTTGLDKGTLLGFIKEVKVDFIAHAYPLVKPLEVAERVRLFSLPDISAMKLNAIARSGQRVKDFIDIYFLLEHFPLRNMIDYYRSKYPKSSEMIPLKALNYFDDLDWEEDRPKMLRPYSDESLKMRLEEALLHPDRVF